MILQVSADEAAAARRRNEMRCADTMCYAASAGDIPTIQRLLDRGSSADVADYDRRTGLMLAAANGQQVYALDLCMHRLS